MNLLSDVITYIRRILKTPSNDTINDSLIIDYINRFWLMDVDARIQLFDLKTVYSFQTIPQICDYNIPLYSTQTPSAPYQIASYPVYQGFTGNAYVNGIVVPVYTQREQFWKIWPNFVQSLNNVEIGDGATQSFTFDLPYAPAIPGHVDVSGIIASGVGNDPIFALQIPNDGTNPKIPYSSIRPAVYINYTDTNGSLISVSDSGIFASNVTNSELTGILIANNNPGSVNPNPFGYSFLGTASQANSTVNYITGEVNVVFPTPPSSGTPIQVQCYYIQPGLPRALLFFNNTISLRPPSNTSYLVELDAYLTPAAFLSSSQALPFAYMAEYIARGAARKILSDTGDAEQFAFYEPLFREQEMLVWKRSQRQFTATRTPTIYSDIANQSGISTTGQGFT